jgi:hypothetical protein
VYLSSHSDGNTNVVSLEFLPILHVENTIRLQSRNEIFNEMIPVSNSTVMGQGSDFTGNPVCVPK